jgi:hypothetical protein
VRSWSNFDSLTVVARVATYQADYNPACSFVAGRPRKLTPEQENLARRLVSEGKAIRELAMAFKVHAATIYRLVQQG